MRVRRLPNFAVVLLVCAGLLGVFGPHLLILGYKAAGAQPPGALLYFCVLHHGGGSGAPSAGTGAHRARLVVGH
jgi:hypothetical protein